MKTQPFRCHTCQLYECPKLTLKTVDFTTFNLALGRKPNKISLDIQQVFPDLLYFKDGLSAKVLRRNFFKIIIYTESIIRVTLSIPENIRCKIAEKNKKLLSPILFSFFENQNQNYSGMNAKCSVQSEQLNISLIKKITNGNFNSKENKCILIVDSDIENLELMLVDFTNTIYSRFLQGGILPPIIVDLSEIHKHIGHIDELLEVLGLSNVKKILQNLDTIWIFLGYEKFVKEPYNLIQDLHLTTHLPNARYIFSCSNVSYSFFFQPYDMIRVMDKTFRGGLSIMTLKTLTDTSYTELKFDYA